jgi:signal transduction histidine kinase
MSLRTKLVLSYLAVTLGAVFVLAFVIGQVVIYNFNQNQILFLKDLAYSYQVNHIYPAYLEHGQLDQSSLADQFTRRNTAPVILVITDQDGDQVWCSYPQFADLGNCDNPTIQKALSQAAHQSTPIEGSLNVSHPHDNDNDGSIQYLAKAVQLHGQFIGTMFIAEPEPNGVTPFLTTVNSYIFLAGIAISLVVVLFSLALARSFTRPIERLTKAAERVKHGQYTERVTESTSEDELGTLAQTFNEMAAQIEADVNELRSQEQARRELIANIAHDLTTPLTAIQGFSEALADDMLPDAQTRQETAQRIAREVQRLRRLVADLQNMTALESGRVRLDLAPLGMHSLIDETLSVIAPECENTGITVLNQTDYTPTVLADSDRITQVLLNLLDNARRHTPAGGTITVRATKEGYELRVWVSDTGKGIDAKDLPHIFERFYRADRSRAAATGGSGLGLAIVKAIITAHGGKVWAQSEPGKGTTIFFTLPLIEEQTGRKLPMPNMQKSRS